MQITSFNAEVQRDTFDCGDFALNHYLQQLAGQHSRKNISKTFIAIDKDKVVGFYSLSMAEAQLEDLPKSISKKLPPYYPVPVARLGRLAVDKTYQGQKLGELLLMHALTRCAQIASEIGTVGVIVDAKHGQAQQFYQKYGFIPFTIKPLTLFMAMQTIIKSLAV